jgi:hypothetical protein
LHFQIPIEVLNYEINKNVFVLKLRKMQEMVAKMQAQMMQAQLNEQSKAIVN